MSVYAQFGVQPIINAAGASTRVGGPLMHPAAAAAMVEAARESVPLDRLQDAASRLIAGVTGAEAGYVTAGAAAGLTLSAAACVAKLDIGIMDRLPDTGGLPNEIVVSREQRNGYDHALRAAGARLVEVGMNERVAAPGFAGPKSGRLRRPSRIGRWLSHTSQRPRACPLSTRLPRRVDSTVSR